MAIVNGSLQEGYKDAAWFAANPTLVLLVGQKVNLEQTGTYKLGDGTTQLSALSFLGGSGSGLSGLTTNKVLKATSSTTAGNSNITDDGTNVGIVTGNSQIYALPTEAGFYYFENNTGIVKVNDSGTYLQHEDLIDLNAPSVTKNGVEVATVNDIPTVDTTIIDGSTNAVSGNAVFDGLATKVNTSDRKGADYFLKIGATTFDSRYSTNVTAFTPTNQVVTKDAMLAMPFIIEETMTFDRIGAEVTVAVASGVCSLLIYDSVNNIPTNLVLDAGTISVTSATYQEITINKQLTAGLYYLVMWHNGPGNPSFRAMPITACNKVLGLSPTLGTGTTYTRIFNANVYTTAPLTYPLTGFNMNSFSNPIISLRRSA